MGNSIERARNINNLYVNFRDRMYAEYTMSDFGFGISCFEKIKGSNYFIKMIFGTHQARKHNVDSIFVVLNNCNFNLEWTKLEM